MKFVATFEVEFTSEEVNRFKELAKQLNKSFPDTVRMCANERADELLTMFKVNVPQSDAVASGKEEPPNGNSLERTRE